MVYLFKAVSIAKIMNTGTKSGLIHVIYNDYGIEVAQRFLDDLQNIVTRYLVLTGFSVGIGDLMADLKTKEKIKNTIVKTKKQVSKLIQQVHQQILKMSLPKHFKMNLRRRSIIYLIKLLVKQVILDLRV